MDTELVIRAQRGTRLRSPISPMAPMSSCGTAAPLDLTGNELCEGAPLVFD